MELVSKVLNCTPSLLPHFIVQSKIHSQLIFKGDIPAIHFYKTNQYKTYQCETTIIYFAHKCSIWSGLGGGNSSLLHQMSAGQFDQVWRILFQDGSVTWLVNSSPCDTLRGQINFLTAQGLGPKSQHPKRKKVATAIFLRFGPETGTAQLLPRFKGREHRPTSQQKECQRMWGPYFKTAIGSSRLHS